MALALPLALFLILATVDVGDLGVHRLAAQGSAATLAGWASWHPADIPGPDWDALVSREADRAGCADPAVVDEWLDDDLGDRHPGSVVWVTLTCRWSPLAPVPGLEGLDLAVAASDVVR